MQFNLDEGITQNFHAATRYEWLETNGLGGWASSTIIGANTRRYHGLLVAATQPPVGRMVLLSKLDETAVVDGNNYALSVNQYPDVVHPTGNQYLSHFERTLFPVFEYSFGNVRIRKTIVALNGENTTLVLYEVLRAPAPFILELRPFVAARDFHGLGRANSAISSESEFAEGVFRIKPYESVPELFIQVPKATFQPDSQWYYNFEYAEERFRGLDYQEDLFTYGTFNVNLKLGEKLGVIISTGNPAKRSAFKLFEKERKRREKLHGKLPVQDDITKTLALAADQFVVKRGNDLFSIIAGYHWFADWGRDTMIALPGISLVTGRFNVAKRILRAFAASASQGMLPNRFPDVGEEPEYNTVDATLWFFVAIYKYLQYSKDKEFVRDELLPLLIDIIKWHDNGTRYNIHVAEDGLLCSGEPGVQLTWMDAKVGDWVVTPRQGKAVEVNALWYNALMIMSELSREFGFGDEADRYTERAHKVAKVFTEVFWEEQNGYLYDCVDGDHKDAAIRPNQIFAISLPFALVSGKRAKQIFSVITEKLVTPFGLRSLSPDDSNYRPHYEGDPLSRDGAYHQGTVWSWLLGPYITALVKIEGTIGQKWAERIIEMMIPHLSDGCIGSISEIFDAESPHRQRGAVAQAWSGAEILRSYIEDVLNIKP